MQTKRALPDRMSIRLSVTYAHVHGQFVQHPSKLDRPAQRALIFSSARFPTRVLLRFPLPDRES